MQTDGTADRHLAWSVDENLGQSIPDLLRARAAATPHDVFLLYDDTPVTVAELAANVRRHADLLNSHGLAAGDRVVIMMPTSPEHVALFLATAAVGAVSVSADIRSRPAQLAYLFDDSQPTLVVFDNAYRDQVLRAFHECQSWGSLDDMLEASDGGVTYLRPGMPVTRLTERLPSDLISLIYTSGTSGPPKGTLVTDRMLRVCADGVRRTTRPVPGDVFFQWESLNHIGGTQMIVLALQHRVTLALVTSFSASRFWDQVRESGATHIHFLGGVLQILHSAHESAADRANRVRVAWGAGCTPEIWCSFEDRFGLEIREVYGLTETSSINTLNDERVIGSMGKPIPGFLVEVVDESGVAVGPQVVGEVRIRGERPGMTTPGYFRNEAATASLYRDGWLYTKDLAYVDETGHIYFVGRRTDSVRRRGENISSWEVERIARRHPQVEECALIGVPSDLGEQELKLFVQPTAGSPIDLEELSSWCLERMPKHQVPRYFSIIDTFQRGPSMRIVKGALSKTVDGAWDREARRYSSKAIRTRRPESSERSGDRPGPSRGSAPNGPTE